ncbi:MAG: transcriptional regulator [Euryarchaeota archaeon]|nr:transcriptional regulator [Euryarchaeota archaeon]
MNNKSFGKKKSIDNFSLIKIGNLIREARISRNQSINELASILKISEQQLKAIEEGREDLLPEKVFIRAMVNRISEKLKLDIKQMMGDSVYKKEKTEIENVEVEPEEKNDENNPIKEEKQNPYFFITIVIISGLVGLYSSSFIFNKISESINESIKQESINQN